MGKIDSKTEAHNFLDFVNASPTRNNILVSLLLPETKRKEKNKNKNSIGFYWRFDGHIANDATAFHAVKSATDLLTAAGFREIKVCWP